MAFKTLSLICPLVYSGTSVVNVEFPVWRIEKVRVGGKKKKKKKVTFSYTRCLMKVSPKVGFVGGRQTMRWKLPTYVPFEINDIRTRLLFFIFLFRLPISIVTAFGAFCELFLSFSKGFQRIFFNLKRTQFAIGFC